MDQQEWIGINNLPAGILVTAWGKTSNNGQEQPLVGRKAVLQIIKINDRYFKIDDGDREIFAKRLRNGENYRFITAKPHLKIADTA